MLACWRSHSLTTAQRAGLGQNQLKCCFVVFCRRNSNGGQAIQLIGLPPVASSATRTRKPELYARASTVGLHRSHRSSQVRRPCQENHQVKQNAEKRSEERRVGKECRARREEDHETKKKKERK